MPGALFAALIPGFLALAGYKVLVEWLTWKADIEIGPSAITFKLGYIWSRRRYEYPRGKRPRLECHQEFRRQSGSSYSVRMVPAEGSACDIIRRLDGQQNAIAVRDWLMKELWKT
jgi:hypothetical protein